MYDCLWCVYDEIINNDIGLKMSRRKHYGSTLAFPYIFFKKKELSKRLPNRESLAQFENKIKPMCM